MARKGVTLTRIAVDRCVRFLSKCRFNLRLCSLGNELILLGYVHEKGRVQPIGLSQIFLSIGAVIPDRGVDAVVAHGCHEDHQRAEAITEDGNLAVALREVAYCVDRVLDVLCSRVSVISSVQTTSVLPVSLRAHVTVNSRLLPPEQVWRNRKEALFCQFVAARPAAAVTPHHRMRN